MKTEILVTRREVMDAYERHTGFRGIGQFFEQEGLIEIIDEEKSCAE